MCLTATRTECFRGDGGVSAGCHCREREHKDQGDTGERLAGVMAGAAMSGRWKRRERGGVGRVGYRRRRNKPG